MTNTSISEAFERFILLRGYKSQGVRDDEKLLRILECDNSRVSKLIIDQRGEVCVVEFDNSEAAAEKYENGLDLLEFNAELHLPQENEVEDFLPLMFLNSNIRFTGLSLTTTRDGLLYFLENKKKSGGGAVLQLSIDNLGTANAVMASSEDAERLLKKRNITFEGSDLRVTRRRLYIDPTARICVTGIIPYSDQNKIKDFFSNTNYSGGGEITEIDYNEEEGKAIITFEDYEAPERIMKRRNDLQLDNTKLRVSMASNRRKHHTLPIYYIDSHQDGEEDAVGLPLRQSRRLSNVASQETASGDASVQEKKSPLPKKPPKLPVRKTLSLPTTHEMQPIPPRSNVVGRGDSLRFKPIPPSWAEDNIRNYLEKICGFNTQSIMISKDDQDVTSAIVVFNSNAKYAEVCARILHNPIPGHRFFVEKLPTSTQTDTIQSSYSHGIHTDRVSRDSGDRDNEYDYSAPTPRDEPEATRAVETRVLPGTMRITLVKGNIVDEDVDVLVNTTSCDLQLDSGGVSGAIFHAAGGSIQDECNTKYPKGIKVGEFAISSAGRSRCKRIYHCACPNWDGVKGRALKVLRTLVKNILKKAQSEEATSVAFPALGTGALGFPQNDIAKLMFEEFDSFVKAVQIPIIRNIHVVVNPADTETVQAFQEYFPGSTLLRKPRKCVSGIFSPSARSVLPEDNNENTCDRETNVTIGSITVTIKEGDITLETTNAIINSTNAEFQFTGAVSAAIKHAAGSTVVDECKALGKITKGFVVTSAGNLPCNYIFHIDAPKNINGWKRVIKGVLNDARKMKLQSITFPALGTGNLQLEPEDMANIIIEAVKDHSKKKSQKLRQINICIFQGEMMKVFEETALQTSTKRKPWLARLFHTFKKRTEDKDNTRPRSNSPGVSRERKMWNTLGPTPPPLPPRASQKVSESGTAERERDDQQIPPPPPRRRSSIAYKGDSEEDKDNTAPRSNSPGVSLARKTWNTSGPGTPPLPPRTSPKASESNTVWPLHWTPMEDEKKFCKIPLLSTETEYLEVSEKFQYGTSAINISKIERIQNTKLYNKYSLEKHYMDYPNEQILWHGTSQPVTEQISANGFNRSFCGKNATRYGKGSYFATNPDFSANYAEPDRNGLQYIYMCRVLTGEFTKGEEHMLEPPPKDLRNKFIHYDSVVDDKENPTIYVIFKDAGAYPEYLITFMVPDS